MGECAVELKRREIREAAFLLCYERSFRADEPLENIFENAREVDEFPFNEEVEGLVRGVDAKKDESCVTQVLGLPPS